MKIKTLLLGSVAAVGLVAGAIATVGGFGGEPVRVTAQTTNNAPKPAPAMQQQQPMLTERERYLATKGTRRRKLNAWDGKNRTAGDRAHKRMKRRRAAGQAA